MKMSKAKEEHVNQLSSWLQFNDELCKINPHNEYEWESFKKNLEDSEDFKSIIEHIEKDEEFDLEKFFEFYRLRISSIHSRILFGYIVLIENACDPDLDYLEFNKDILKGLELLKKSRQNKE